jgi:hypothetical protein
LRVEFYTEAVNIEIRVREAEKSALLEAVVRERLKKQKAAKSLVGVVMVCIVWRLANKL